MSARFKIYLVRIAVLGLSLLLTTAALEAGTIRVTTWNLQPGSAAGSNALSKEVQKSLAQEAAASLKKLHPDVILLQQVSGWDVCQQLAQALKPDNYQVALCSSFRDARGKLLRGQTAIIARNKALISWSDSWRAGASSPAAEGGFAFAAIRLDGKTAGLFSVQMGGDFSPGPSAGREEAAAELVKQIETVQGWKNNRPQAFIVAGDFNTTPDDATFSAEKTLAILEQAGFANAFAGLPLENRITLPGTVTHPAATLDYVFARNATVTAPPTILQASLPEHCAVTCEIDLTAAKPPPTARVETLPAKVQSAANSSSASVVVASGTLTPGKSHLVWWLAGIVAGGIAAFIFVPRIFSGSRARKISGGAAAVRGDQVVITPALEKPPYVHVEIEGSTHTQSQTWRPPPEFGRLPAQIPEPVRAGVVATLSRWFKEKFVQRLLSDRAELLATQHAAALQLLAVDERLSKIENQIRNNNNEYERRIDSLMQELVTAKEENRVLIRAKIALARAEMEKARLKSEQRARENEPR